MLYTSLLDLCSVILAQSIWGPTEVHWFDITASGHKGNGANRNVFHYLKFFWSFSVIFSLGSVFAFGELEDFRLKSYYILFLDTFCFDFFVFVGGRRLFRSCMSALHCLNFFLFENPYRPLQYSLSGSFSEDWFPEGSLFAWTLKYFNCKGIFIEFSSSL